MGKTIDFRVVTAAQDRHGTVIDAAGMDLTGYRNNPVVLFNHDYNRVVGRSPGIAMRGGDIIGPVEFDEKDAFAADVLRKVESGYLSGASAGFLVHDQEGNRITRAELVEFSIVSVPSNPEALAMRTFRSIGGREIRYVPAVRFELTTGTGKSTYSGGTNSPLSDGLYERVLSMDMTPAQRAAIDQAAATAAHELALDPFEVVVYVPLVCQESRFGASYHEDDDSGTNGQMTFRDPSRIYVRMRKSPWSMARTVFHEARHVWQGKQDAQAESKYTRDPKPYEDDANAYAARAVDAMQRWSHNAWIG